MVIINKGKADETDLGSLGLKLVSDVIIPAPVPKTNFIDIPGADGAIDASESPQGFPVFNNREISWQMFLRAGDKRLDVIRDQLMLKFHGKRVTIHFPFSNGFYFSGRISFGDFNAEQKGFIPFTAVVDPYRYKDSITEVTKTITTSYSNVTLTNIGRAVAPIVSTGQQTQVKVNDVVYLYNPEDKVWDEDVKSWLIPAGGGLSEAASGGIYSSITVQARIYDSETGGNQVTFRYQEAIL